MKSRPLLDYLAHSEDAAEPSPDGHPLETLEERLRDLEARLRANAPAAEPPEQDLTLSAQIEAILRRKAASPAEARQATTSHEARERPARQARMAVEPPSMASVPAETPAVDPEFLKFTEAVYLMGQAAKRFIEQPQHHASPAPTAQAVPASGEIGALAAVLRETVSAFRSVADDLAVSAGEIRNMATRGEGFAPARRSPRSRPRDDDDEILELRETVADLQDRLDALLAARRRSRY